MENSINIKYLLHRKLNYASLKATQLENSISAYLGYSKSFDLIGSHSKGKTVITYKMKILMEPDYTGWSILLGDLAHTLRSILDNLIYNLSDTPCRDNMFPIFTSKVEYKQKEEKCLAGISNDDIFNTVENLQPYKIDNPEKHILELLREIDNSDKHRSNCIALFLPTEISVNPEAYFKTKENTQKSKITLNGKPLHNGCWVLKYKFQRPFVTFSDHPQIQYQVMVNVKENWYPIKELTNNLLTQTFDISNKLGIYL